jgi:hypothetical protein
MSAQQQHEGGSEKGSFETPSCWDYLPGTQ